jgi:hypothetical protein
MKTSLIKRSPELSFLFSKKEKFEFKERSPELFFQNISPKSEYSNMSLEFVSKLNIYHLLHFRDLYILGIIIKTFQTCTNKCLEDHFKLMIQKFDNFIF